MNDESRSHVVVFTQAVRGLIESVLSGYREFSCPRFLVESASGIESAETVDSASVLTEVAWSLRNSVFAVRDAIPLCPRSALPIAVGEGFAQYGWAVKPSYSECLMAVAISALGIAQTFVEERFDEADYPFFFKAVRICFGKPEDLIRLAYRVENELRRIEEHHRIDAPPSNFEGFRRIESGESIIRKNEFIWDDPWPLYWEASRLMPRREVLSLTPVEESKDTPPLKDGPQLGCQFAWKGELSPTMQPLPFHVLKYMWGREIADIAAVFLDAKGPLYDTSDTAVKSALNKANQALLSTGYELRLKKEKNRISWGPWSLPKSR